MNCYRVERRAGWDCHRLPVEYEVRRAEGPGAAEKRIAEALASG
jgi:isoleucyl-tRNA synthetase